MKAVVFLTGPHEAVNRMGTKCRKSTTYEWELLDVSMGALTKLRHDLAQHHASGIAKPLVVIQEDINNDRVVTIRLALKQPVLKGTMIMVNTAVKKALRDRRE